MKKILMLICTALMIFTICVLPVMAETELPETGVETYGPPLPQAAATVTTEPEPQPGEPMTWAYLVTIGGATAATLLIVQYFKAKLDKVWKIPTRVFVYIIALVILLLATHFTQGLTVDNAILTVINAFVVAAAAFGAYEVTFKKLEH